MSKWISVKDRLPEKEKEILIVSDNEVKIGIWSNDCFGEKFFTTNFEQYLNADNVTHWMPLPEPPK